EFVTGAAGEGCGREGLRSAAKPTVVFADCGPRSFPVDPWPRRTPPGGARTSLYLEGWYPLALPVLDPRHVHKTLRLAAHTTLVNMKDANHMTYHVSVGAGIKPSDLGSLPPDNSFISRKVGFFFSFPSTLNPFFVWRKMQPTRATQAIWFTLYFLS
ncbi:hypothetical protein H1C71_037813, partial [Ictidomys tridecemlineatus]